MKLLYKKNDKAVFIFIVLFFLINMFYLDAFPFVHADEAWLFSLSRAAAVEKSFSAVEDFFILTERHPHALKILFHLIQIPFVMFSFSINSARILSLVFSVINIYFFYLLIKKNIKSSKIILFTVLILAADIQYIYISRFARQEIIILTLMTVNLYILLNNLNIRKIILSAVINGLAVGIHPNSFIIFTASLFLLSSYLFTGKMKIKKTLKYITVYILIVSLAAALFILISLLMDSNFFSNYLEFGSRHGVSDIFIVKILKLRKFYYKMFNRISGTYFLPDIRFQLIIFILSAVLITVLSVFKRKIINKTVPALMFAAGINAGLIIIGKYSPPSISFIFPAGWYLTAMLLDNLKIKNTVKIIIMTSLLVMLLNNSITEILRWKDNKYNDYMNRITAITDDGERVFGSINTSFYMNYRQLAAYNDLEYFEKREGFFENYIRDNNIRYILYSDEFDIIYRERPLWNDLYGNIYPFYNEINKYLYEKCLLKGEVYDEVYPVRITDYMGRKKYKVKVYKVKDQK